MARMKLLKISLPVFSWKYWSPRSHFEATTNLELGPSRTDCKQTTKSAQILIQYDFAPQQLIVD